MTKQLERKYYGEEPLFVYDPKDDRNRPVPGTDRNLRIFWNVYPDYIREIFTRAFSQEVMLDRGKRVLEKEWLDVFFRLKASIVKCPKCGEETFVTQIGQQACIECKAPITVQNAIRFNSVTLPLYPGVKIMLYHADSFREDLKAVLGEVVANPNNPTEFGIRNVSGSTFKITLPDGSQRPLESGKLVPVKKDFVIDCTGNQKDAGTVI